MLRLIVEASIHWMEIGLPMKELKIVLYQRDTKEISKVNKILVDLFKQMRKKTNELAMKNVSCLEKLFKIEFQRKSYFTVDLLWKNLYLLYFFEPKEYNILNFSWVRIWECLCLSDCLFFFLSVGTKYFGGSLKTCGNFRNSPIWLRFSTLAPWVNIWGILLNILLYRKASSSMTFIWRMHLGIMKLLQWSQNQSRWFDLTIKFTTNNKKLTPRKHSRITFTR